MPIHTFLHEFPLFISIWFNSSIPLPTSHFSFSIFHKIHYFQNFKFGISKSYKIKLQILWRKISNSSFFSGKLLFFSLFSDFDTVLTAFWRELGLGFFFFSFWKNRQKGVALLVWSSWVMRNRLLPWRAENEIESFLFPLRSPLLMRHLLNLRRLPPRLIILAERYNLGCPCFIFNWLLDSPTTFLV